MTLSYLVSIFVLTVSFAQASGPVEDPKIVSLKEKAVQCFENEARDFLKTTFNTSFDFQNSTFDFGFGKEVYSIFVVLKAKAVNSDCLVELSLMRSSLGLLVNNFCTISPHFTNYYLAYSDVHSCAPPAIEFKAIAVNDGYDQYGEAINPRMEFKSDRVEKGECLQQRSPLFFRNSSTRKPTKLTFNLEKVHQCFSQ